MPAIRDAYLLALYDLKRADIAKWETFLVAFRALTDYEYERALSSPASETLIAVGSGRRLRDLKEDFIHIDNLVAKIKK